MYGRVREWAISALSARWLQDWRAYSAGRLGRIDAQSPAACNPTCIALLGGLSQFHKASVSEET